MRLRLCLFSCLLIPVLAVGANKDIVELQRDLATLQDQVRTMQSSTAEKLAALTVLVQQTLDAANNTNKGVAVADSRVNDRLEKQAVTISQQIAVQGTKVDQMSSDFAGMRESLNDVVSRMGKLEQKLDGLNKAMQAMQAPPPAPTGTTGASAPALPPPDTLYESALRDKMGGKPEMALKGFSDYVQNYHDTDKAQSAQFWIGMIFYEQGDYQNALKNFDSVLVEYSQDTKKPEAMLKKGQTLVKLNQPTAGQTEFRGVLKKYPNSDSAPIACAELRKLGFNCSAGAPPMKKKTTKARG